MSYEDERTCDKGTEPSDLLCTAAIRGYGAGLKLVIMPDTW
jgi:hypothetical protein